MEKFKNININDLERSEHINYFLYTKTVIEFTVKVDVTKSLEICNKEDYSFSAFIIYQLSKTINSLDSFLYDLHEGDFVKWEKLVPTFNILNPKTKTFSSLWLELSDDFCEFQREYTSLVKTYRDSLEILPQKTIPPNTFSVSIIPWLHFEHFSSNSKMSGDKLSPMITVGKYKRVDDRIMMPLTMQVHHAIADGYHVSKFFSILQENLNSY